jgi:hypothetical protein
MTIRNLHLNILIGLNSFIVFFVLFEDKIDIPVYLQVFGRLHPLLLHFPIVLLFVSWLLVFFRQKLEKLIPELKSILNGLIFISALFAAGTVIMGLFLSKEGGYEGSSFQWHKWTGVALSLLAFLLLYYHSRQKKDRYPIVFKVGMNLSLLLLLFVGHFGANLTHGDNYVLAPLNNGQSTGLDMDKAFVYEDAVFQILETNCIGCHNDKKPKGELILTDTASLLAGGKNGKLFVAGSPQESLIIERLLLDIDHKHRMPPKGKPQLTNGELALIEAWVSNGAKFNLPLSFLSERDTLFQAIKMVYDVNEVESYGFKMADADLIEKLNTPYRVVKPLADGSPALAVHFFARDFYTAESLPELVPLANQVVSLNLSGMPVSAEDLKVLATFKNLRDLNLNYTPLDDRQLESIATLPMLKSLNLSGTALTATGLKDVLALSTLRKLFVWNTQIDENSLTSLSQTFPSVYIEGGAKDDGTLQLPLTKPRITPSQSFFRQEVPVSFSHPIAGVEIRYTLDGSDPDSINAIVYEKPLLIDKNVTLRVKAFKSGWMPSEEITQTYSDAPIAPDRTVLDNRPHYLFRAKEGASLFDLERGRVGGFPSHFDGKWIGFRNSNLSSHLFFDSPLTIDTLSLSVKQHYNDYGYFIYPPEYIEVWGGLDSNNVKLLAKISPVLEKPDQVNLRRMIPCPINTDNIGYIKLVAMPYSQIPEGYPAGGQPSWLFLDEIVIK